MKLHLGCGDFYIPSALNLDKYDLRVADIQADAVHLPFISDAFDSVAAYHILEHLGNMRAVYALSEWFRVLEPGGVLELETPDLEGSFRAFLEKKEPIWRAGVLTWIFGEEIPGMGHGGLFPKELLEKMVRESGFNQLRFETPQTQRHRWAKRLVAVKGNDVAAHFISRLRPSLAYWIFEEGDPQEAIEIELKLWCPLRELIQGSLSQNKAEDLLLECTVLAPRVILLLAKLAEEDQRFPPRPDLKKYGQLADSAIRSHLCDHLRQAFLVMCTTVNQIPDGYEHLLKGAKTVLKKWLTVPPQKPHNEIIPYLEACGVMIGPQKDLTFPGDMEVASGERSIDGRRPVWPKHHLFTRQHLIKRAQWYRDLGIRCFGNGQLEEARRLFRLAINSKMEGLYSVWNMARLQVSLGQKENARSFYEAALDFPMSEEVKERILHELKACPSGRPIPSGPVSVGEGQDRIFGILEEGRQVQRSIKGNLHSQESVFLPAPKTLLWELTLKCQCRCTHCAASGGNPRPYELNTEEALKVCDQIAELGVPSVCLMGGEALLRTDWEFIAHKLREYGVCLGLATNGIALNRPVWKKLEDLGFAQMVISLDGIHAEIHDKRRRRKGALASAQRAIMEMTSRPFMNKTVVTSIDKTNIKELPAIRDWLLEHTHGITWMLNMANPTSGSRMARSTVLDKEDFLSIVRFIFENRAPCQDGLDITGTHNIGYFSQQYHNLHNYIWSGCQAGISTLGLRSDGNVTGCLIMSDFFIEGNVRQRSLSEIWHDTRCFLYNRGFSADHLMGKCASCPWGEMCKGGCRETAFSFTGGFFESPFCLYHLESAQENQNKG